MAQATDPNLPLGSGGGTGAAQGVATAGTLAGSGCRRAAVQGAITLTALLPLVGSLDSRPATAAWPSDPALNLPVCAAVGAQWRPHLVSDGAGGAIVVWQDGRNGTDSDVYAQHVLASGETDPVWPVDGLAICEASGDQGEPELVPDDAGGAIVLWQDRRDGTRSDIYALRVLASGGVDPSWPADGLAVCTAPNDQVLPNAAPDGAGGALVLWCDFRTGTASIYGQHALASGSTDPAWPASGLAVCTVNGTYGAGGAIVTWDDARTGTNWGIYASHVLASGTADPAWPAGGLALCTTDSSRYQPRIAADGAGGGIVAWYDLRAGTEFDVYTQHVTRSGVVDPAWPPLGVATSVAPSDQYEPQAIADGVGGAIVLWQDYRTGWDEPDIYAQRVDLSGTLGGTVSAPLKAPTSGAWFAPPLPNPAREGTQLRFRQPRAGRARLAILDASGREVRVLADGERGAGEHTERWDLGDSRGRAVATGVYFARLDCADGRLMRAVVVMR